MRIGQRSSASFIARRGRQLLPTLAAEAGFVLRYFFSPFGRDCVEWATKLLEDYGEIRPGVAQERAGGRTRNPGPTRHTDHLLKR